MLGKIINAFSIELQTLFEGTGITVLRDTDQDENDLSAHTIPVVILDLQNSDETDQSIGGATSAQFDWTIRAYIYDSNSYLSNDYGLSASAYDLIDEIKNHLASQQFLSDEFNEIVTNYSFKLTLAGTQSAQKIKHGNGIIPGRQINYKSSAIDTSTAYTKISESPLKYVEQNLYF